MKRVMAMNACGVVWSCGAHPDVNVRIQRMREAVNAGAVRVWEVPVSGVGL